MLLEFEIRNDVVRKTCASQWHGRRWAVRRHGGGLLANQGRGNILHALADVLVVGMWSPRKAVGGVRVVGDGTAVAGP